MLFYLLLLFTLVPLVEIMILIEIGRAISLWPTIGLILFTGFVGAALARHQGIRTWSKIRTDMAEGKLPAESLVDGLLIFVAGTLLITPGVLTDCAGFSLLIPFVRGWLRQRATRYIKAHMVVMTNGQIHEGNDDFIDVDADVVSPEHPENQQDSRHLR